MDPPPESEYADRSSETNDSKHLFDDLCLIEQNLGSTAGSAPAVLEWPRDRRRTLGCS
jgi:hypothetical protein